MKSLHCSFLFAALALIAAPTAAQDVSLIGVIGDKAAVLAVDGGDPKTVKVGQKWNGITVLAVSRDQATIEVGGKKRVLARGQHYRATPAPASAQSVTLAADSSGHFFIDGMINGLPVRMVLDTGATTVALPASDAQRLGIDYRKGERGTAQTANGSVEVYRVRFDNVKVGAIDISGVEGIVIEQGLGVALLGMTFLNRVEMRREGQHLILTKRF